MRTLTAPNYSALDAEADRPVLTLVPVTGRPDLHTVAGIDAEIRRLQRLRASMADAPDPDSGSVAMLGRVVAAAADIFGVEPLEMAGRSRIANIAAARMAAATVLLEATGWTTGLVGHLFGRDHTWAVYCRQAVRERCEVDRAFAARVNELRRAMGIR